MEGIDGYEIKLYLVSSPETINPPHDVLKKLEYFDVRFCFVIDLDRHGYLYDLL